MNYNADRAITQIEDDLIGRSSFSKALGKAICDCDSLDSIVLGLYGKWGSGKTSIANMAMQTVLELSEHENKPIILRFSPWNYTDKDNLISLFFRALSAAIDGSDNTEIKAKVGDTLKEYAGLFDSLSLIPLVGTAAAAATKGAAQLLGNYLANQGDLDTYKKNLEVALKESNQRFIIIIDDIDRLTKYQICDVFQLVKQVADLPHIMYVLLMDRDIVKNALTEVHNCDGNDYLEKIVQIPFEIPEINKARLNDIVRSKLVESLQKTPREGSIDYAYWTVVFRNCISPFIYTLRDVNRLLNTFCFKYDMMYSETAFEDMVSITTIEVLEPELYRWIINHKSDLCVKKVDPWLSSRVRNSELRSYYSDEFAKLNIEPQRAIKCLSTLFPVFSDKVGYSIKSADDSNLRSIMRVANEERFELYFVLDLENVKVPRHTIRECIISMSAEMIEKTILEVNDQGNIVYFLEELESLIGIIPYDRIQVVASVLYKMKPMLKGSKKQSYLPLSASIISDEIARSIIKRLKTSDERYEFYLKRIDHCSIEELVSLSNDLKRIESAWGRTSSVSENIDEQLVSVDQLDELEQRLVGRLKSANSICGLIEIEGFYDLYCFWNRIDKDSADEFVHELMKNNVYTLKFLCKLAGKWTGTDGNGWSFKHTIYRSFISKEKFYSLICEVGVKQLDEFGEDERLKMATFILEYNDDNQDHVSEQDAKVLVEQWRKSLGSDKKDMSVSVEV